MNLFKLTKSLFLIAFLLISFFSFSYNNVYAVNYPDLTSASLNIEQDPSATYYKNVLPGQSFSISFNVFNRTSIPVKDFFNYIKIWKVLPDYNNPPGNDGLIEYTVHHVVAGTISNFIEGIKLPLVQREITQKTNPETVVFNHVFNSEGVYLIKFCADRGSDDDLVGVIVEAPGPLYPGETNNCARVRVNVGSNPDLVVSSITRREASNSPAIAAAYIATIKNIGNLINNTGFQTIFFLPEPGVAGMTGFGPISFSPIGISSLIPPGSSTQVLITDNSIISRLEELRVPPRQYGGTPDSTLFISALVDRNSRESFSVGEVSELNEMNNYNTKVMGRIILGTANLIAQNPSPLVAIAGEGVEYSSIIKNFGTHDTRDPFNNIFQISTLPNGGGIKTDYLAVPNPMPKTPINYYYSEWSSSTAKKIITLNAGTYSIRACADKNSDTDTGDIPEASETDNCSDWKTLVVSPSPITTYTVTGTAGAGGQISPATQTVSAGGVATLSITPNNNFNNGYVIGSIGGTCPAGTLTGNTYKTGAINANCTVTVTFLLMTGTLTPSNSGCTIASGASSCVSETLTWTTTNPVATSAVTNNGSATPSSPSGNNGSSAFNVPYLNAMNGVTTFYLYNNAKLLATATVNVCTSGTSWNGTICINTPSIIPPIANAGVDKAITLPTSTSAPTEATATDTAPGTISSTVWTQVGSTPSVATITNETTLSPSFSNLTTVGTYTFRLTATDNQGATGSDDMSVFVSPEVMTGTLTGFNCTIANGASNCSTTLSWSINNTESESSAITASSMADITLSTPTIGNDYSGTKTVTVPYSSRTFFLHNNAKSLVPTIESPAGSGVRITATCVSGTAWDGTICTSSNVIPPVANAGVDKAITLPTNSVSVTGTASDTAPGTVTSTSWSRVSGPVTATIVSPGSLTTNIVGMTAVGTYVFRLRATDNQGATGLDDMNVFVSSSSLYPMTGTLTSSAPSCTIASGASSCNVNLTWGIENPEGNPTAITASGMTDINVTNTLTTPQSGTSNNVVVPYSSRTFFLYNNAKSLVPTIESPAGSGVRITATCVSGTAWDGKICKPGAGFTVMGIGNTGGKITPDTQTVVAGGIASLTITPDAGYIAKAKGCDGTLDGTKYTTGPINADCTVTASFDFSGGSGDFITASDCEIKEGESTCNTILDWNTLNPISTSAVTTPEDITVAKDNSGNDILYEIGRGDRFFFLYNNGVKLAEDSATAECILNTHWDDKKGVCVIDDIVGPPVVNGLCLLNSVRYLCGAGTADNKREDTNFWYWDCVGSGGGSTAFGCKESRGGGGLGSVVIDFFKATPSKVLKGRSSVLSWSATGATSCTGTGDGFNTGDSTSGSVPVSPSATTIYKLSCTDGTSSVPDETTVQVILPVIIEN